MTAPKQRCGWQVRAANTVLGHGHGPLLPHHRLKRPAADLVSAVWIGLARHAVLFRQLSACRGVMMVLVSETRGSIGDQPCTCRDPARVDYQGELIGRYLRALGDVVVYLDNPPAVAFTPLGARLHRPPVGSRRSCIGATACALPSALCELARTSQRSR